MKAVISERNISVIEIMGNSLSAGTIAADEAVHFGEGCWWLARLIVRPEYRGKGLGSRFVKRLQEEIVKKPGFKFLLVAPGGYDSDPQRIFEFYRRHGFVDREDGALIWERPHETGRDQATEAGADVTATATDEVGAREGSGVPVSTST